MKLSTMRATLSYALSGRKLFLKIFLWFWLSVLGILGAFFIAPRLTDLHVIRPPNIIATVAPILAAQAVQAYETDGPEGFARFAKVNIEDQDKMLLLLDGDYHDVLAREVSPDGLKLAHKAKAGEITVFRSQIAAFKYISAKGKPYVFLLYLNRELGSVLGRTGSDQLIYGSSIVLVVTLLCYWLAHHIASPILLLQEAARSVARGDLQARAPLRLLKRHDEMRELTSDFNMMVERIEALMQSQKRLLASVSHEVRSPLTRLTVAVALLRKLEREETRFLLERVDREVSTVDILMGQLLTLSRLEAGVERGPSQILDLADLLDEIVSDANFEVEPANKAVRFHCGSSVMVHSPDVTALRSALENVVRNAGRFTCEGSTVEVTVKSVAVDGDAVVTVEDCGPGVPEACLSSIFEPFFRLQSAQEEQVGNGLGLTIAAEAISLHRGTITAHNRAAGGLSVTILLPLAVPVNIL